VPDGLRYLAEVKQTPARNQLCATVIGSTIHIDQFLIVRQGVIKMVVEFFQTFE
jgi:hypothetical protein